MTDWQCPACDGDHANDYIGASEAAPILGLGHWAGPLDIYLRKVGEAGPDEAGIPARFGLAVERLVGDLYEEDTGVTLRKSHRLIRHPEHPMLATHLDFIGPDGLIVEAKTSGSAHGWGEPPDGEIPPDYWVQVQHQMMVTGAPFVDIAVVIRSREFRRYRVPRDERFIGELQQTLLDWWQDHVMAGVPPEVDGSERTTAWLALQHPDETGIIKPATAEQQLLVQKLRGAMERRRAASEDEDVLKNRIRDIIGDDSGLRGEGFTITWKRTKDGKPKVDWQGLAGVYRALIEQVVSDTPLPDGFDLPAAPLGHLDEVEQRYTTPGRPGTRRLVPRFTEEEA